MITTWVCQSISFLPIWWIMYWRGKSFSQQRMWSLCEQLWRCKLSWEKEDGRANFVNKPSDFGFPSLNNNKPKNPTRRGTLPLWNEKREKGRNGSWLKMSHTFNKCVELDFKRNFLRFLLNLTNTLHHCLQQHNAPQSLTIIIQLINWFYLFLLTHTYLQPHNNTITTSVTQKN